MLFPFLQPVKCGATDDHPLVVTHERPSQNTSEGGEFLDDALCVEDFPPAEAEELAAGAAEDRNEPLNEAVRELKDKGYAVDLSFETETFALYGGDLDMRLNPDAYHVDEIDLVDDTSTPTDEEAFVFAISLSGGIKGIIVDRASPDFR